MNIELLERVKEAILANPQHFDMSCWGNLEKNNGGFTCNSAACIAGWAVFLEKGIMLDNQDVESEAQRLLRLYDGEAYQLFYDSNWPDEFEDRYRDAAWADNYAEIARAAAARIDRFLATGGKE